MRDMRVQVDLSKATNVMDRWINAATRLLTNSVRCSSTTPSPSI